MSNNNNKSLYIYTGLIFLVAVVLIIIAFFGQSRLQKNQPIPVSPQENQSITEKAAVLSNENKALLEENSALRQEIEEIKASLAEEKISTEVYKKSKENTSYLLSANNFYEAEEYDKALEAFNKVDESILTDEEKIIYTKVKNAVENTEN